MKSVYPAGFILKFKPSPYPQFGGGAGWGGLPKSEFHTLEPLSSVAADQKSASERSTFLRCLHAPVGRRGSAGRRVEAPRRHSLDDPVVERVRTDESPSR